MKKHVFIERFALALLGAALFPGEGTARTQKDSFCLPLRAFIASAKRGETKSIQFETSWLTGFKGSPKNTMFEKRCVDNGYALAKPVCDYLMRNGQIEFAGNNALRAIECLSARTHFADSIQLDRLDVSFSYGMEQRGSNVTIQFSDDSKLGAMVMNISSEGY
jgi:hypothetical protein